MSTALRLLVFLQLASCLLAISTGSNKSLTPNLIDPSEATRKSASKGQLFSTSEIPQLFDTDQLELMQMKVRKVILNHVEPCSELYEHFKNTPSSLDYLSRQGAELMLKLAIVLDETMNPILLSMIFKQ